MKQHTEQVIIAASSTATKGLGTVTAATGTVGVFQFLVDHQQLILMSFTAIGVFLTFLSYQLNKKYQKKRNDREEEHNQREREAEERRILAHAKEMAIKDFRLQELKESAQQKRRQEDKE